ncbi:MAG: hypothetical protein HY719_09145, partial [Planctomycetes bacterium]|nr:hypothetical protein [Planctomycetota bacterium]
MGVPEYRHDEIELRWQKAWADALVFKCATHDARPKYYCLMMFPYPSGTLHV